MRTSSVLTMGALSLGALLLMGSGCPFIPDVKEKVIQLAVGSSTTVEFKARGSINEYNQEEMFDFGEDIDLPALLDDAGIDVNDVIDIALAGVSYRISLAQEGRSIENGSVTVRREGGSDTPFVTDFSESASAVTDFMTADLDSAGVAVVNDMLDDLLAEAQGNPSSGSLVGYATVSGLSVPPTEETFFNWELKIDITVVGNIRLDVVDF